MPFEFHFKMYNYYDVNVLHYKKIDDFVIFQAEKTSQKRAKNELYKKQLK